MEFCFHSCFTSTLGAVSCCPALGGAGKKTTTLVPSRPILNAFFPVTLRTLHPNVPPDHGPKHVLRH
jgi:hypothetical protein